jgi:hypothetical protein
MSKTRTSDASAILGDLIGGGTMIAMRHPDGGSCDLYATDANGRLIVPAIDVPVMAEHGFVVAGEEA